MLKVKYAESKGANNSNLALRNASKGGYFDIVKYDESKGDNDWNEVLSQASYGGYLDIVK